MENQMSVEWRCKQGEWWSGKVEHKATSGDSRIESFSCSWHEWSFQPVAVNMLKLTFPQRTLYCWCLLLFTLLTTLFIIDSRPIISLLRVNEWHVETNLNICHYDSCDVSWSESQLVIWTTGSGFVCTWKCRNVDVDLISSTRTWMHIYDLLHSNDKYVCLSCLGLMWETLTVQHQQTFVATFISIRTNHLI